MKTIIRSITVYFICLGGLIHISGQPVHGVVITTSNQTDCTTLYAIHRYLRTYGPDHKAIDFNYKDRYALRLGEPVYIIGRTVENGKLEGLSGGQIAEFVRQHLNWERQTRLHLFVFTSYAGTRYGSHGASLVGDICTGLTGIGVAVEVRGPDGYGVTDAMTPSKDGPRIVDKAAEPLFLKFRGDLTQRYKTSINSCGRSGSLSERIDSAGANEGAREINKALLSQKRYFYRPKDHLIKKRCGQ